jgi:hypothetical protein
LAGLGQSRHQERDFFNGKAALFVGLGGRFEAVILVGHQEAGFSHCLHCSPLIQASFRQRQHHLLGFKAVGLAQAVGSSPSQSFQG